MATQKVVVDGSTVSARQMKDFWRQVDDGSITGTSFQLFLDHQNPFALDRVRFDWFLVYKALGMEEDFKDETAGASDKNIFVSCPAGYWDVYALKGVTPNMVVRTLHALGVGMSLYVDNLDRDVPTNDRDPAKGSYRVRFKQTIEVDPELKNKSAGTLVKEKVKGITLLERLLLELAYFLATKKHLDNENVTLCSGSRDSGGDVPSVNWDTDDRKMYVGWCSPSRSYGSIRARAVVS